MSRSTIERYLLKKMVAAQADVSSYLSLRRAKGYMSVTESEKLRDSLFEVCHEYREQAPTFTASLAAHQAASFERGIAALSAAAISLMTGRHDCPHYIAIDADKLESCLHQLSDSLNELHTVQLAIDA
ncbi:biofilm formation regulator BssR [Dryocola clanedunensis]|uniref:biofilm formation regulator BssR n=1 Tax=Cedecea sulfonylureivorans TaxID=3051154 RepID=UPI0019274EB1|nr:biofilm formation regulator BssR [Cedecea sulfonylureivorans]